MMCMYIYYYKARKDEREREMYIHFFMEDTFSDGFLHPRAHKYQTCYILRDSSIRDNSALFALIFVHVGDENF